MKVQETSDQFHDKVFELLGCRLDAVVDELWELVNKAYMDGYHDAQIDSAIIVATLADASKSAMAND